MKRANGTGTIVRLKGDRRKPFAVRISARNKYGRIEQKTLGYYAKSHEAQEALDEYNQASKAGTATGTDKLSMTLCDVYELWSARKYAKAGDASITSYRASWVRLEALSAVKMRDVTLDQLQGIIDHDEAGGLSKSSINNDRTLMRALYKFAMERDIVSKDYSAFLQIPVVGAKYEKGTFTDSQIKQIEALAEAGDLWANTVLMLCYTGFRINEFLGLTPFSYDRAGDYLRGGLKTAAGRDRVVPVHPKIKKYLMSWLDLGGDTIVCNQKGARLAYGWYIKNAFDPIMQQIGAESATPHWCRHTFSSRLHASGAPELEQKRLLGHADKDVTEHYTHTDIEQLRDAIKLLA